MNKMTIALVLAGSAMTLSGTATAQTAPAAAADAEVLRQQLAAQLAINQQLRQRIDLLEQRLVSRREDDGPLVIGLDADAAKPPPDLESDIANTALEQALVGKGVLLLPIGTYRVTPGFTWIHDGAGASRRDAYLYTIGIEAGLPWGMAASLSEPYIRRDYPAGSNRGPGDITVGLSKKLNNQSAHLPSLVVRLDYTHDNGDDAFTAVPVGGGQRRLDLSLSAVKLVEPLALFGTLSYGHAWSTTARFLVDNAWQTARIEAADSYGLGLGVSLAATPDISLDAALNLDFRGEMQVTPSSGTPYHLPSTTVGYATLGATFVLHRNLSLSLSAAAGVTDDADDFLLGITLPYRF